MGLTLSQAACSDPASHETQTRAARSPLTVAGLVAAFGFDEGTGSATADDTENVHDAALTGQTWVAGKYGNALDFDGSYLTTTASSLLELDSAMTLSAWVIPTGEVPDWRTVIRKDDGTSVEYVLYADANPSAPYAIVNPCGPCVCVPTQEGRRLP